MKDPETLADDSYTTPPPFEGEQILSFSDYDLREKPTGFWLMLDLRGENGERASWSGNFHKAPDTPGRQQNHNISWAGLRQFFKAAGMTDGDLPACGPKAIATALNKLVTVDGNPLRVRAKVALDNEGRFMNAGNFKAA